MDRRGRDGVDWTGSGRRIVRGIELMGGVDKWWIGSGGMELTGGDDKWWIGSGGMELMGGVDK